MKLEMNIFSGVKVLELASILAGPLVGSFFAELGAEVIKIENKRQGGDSTRQWKLPMEQGNISAYYAAANYHKKAVLLDLKSDRDHKVLQNHIREADIIITNYQKHTSEKLKISLDDLRALNNDCIIAQLNAYSYEDPRPGFDMVMQAETGFISMNGTKEGEVVKMPVALIDILAAHQMKEAILLAYIQKLRSGQGSIIHVSLYQSAISALANQASNYLMANHVPKPLGTEHPNIAPYGDMYRTKDNKLLILAIGSDFQFEKLVKTLRLDQELLLTFKFNRSRVENRSDLNAILTLNIMQWCFEDLATHLQNNNVPFCEIKDMKSVFEYSLAKEMILHHEIEGQSCRSVSNVAFEIFSH